LAAVNQFVRFGCVGLTNTAVTLIAYAVAVRLGVAYLPAGALAYGLGGLNGFVLNGAWTFRRRGRPFRYGTVVVVGIAANLVLLRFVVALGVPHEAAQLAVVAPVTLVTFALSRSWAFAAHDAPTPSPPHIDARRAARGRWSVGARRDNQPAPAGDRG
jgi:putative flippase GtrA